MKEQSLPQSAMAVLTKRPRINVLGSTHFMKEMVEAKEKLCEMGYNGTIHPHYEAFVRGEMKEHLEKWHKGEKAQLKRENNYLKTHYAHILESDAILFINAEKNGKKNYIGPNVLIEMGQAFVNNKKMFLMYDMPTDSPFIDEIDSMDPICLKGDFAAIRKYI
jgi:hypothetical protein